VKTQLNTRILWFDGTCEVVPELVPSLLLQDVHPNQIAVTSFNEDILQFNQYSLDVFITQGKTANNQPCFDYQIPEKYKSIDLELHLAALLQDLPESYIDRTLKELVEIRSRNMEMLVRTLIYVVDTFKENNVVWGVGRGSSCASLILFLIGLHKVDPVRYDIPMEEFFHS
jgi:DNA polymerase III alpha subunit